MTPDPWRSSTEVSSGLVSSTWRTCCWLACCPVSHCGGGGHVVDDQHAVRGQRRDGAVQPFPFTALGISEDEIEAARLAQHVQCVGAPQFHETRPVTLGGQCRGAGVLFHREDRDVGPRQQRGGYPGGADPGTGAKLKHPGPGRQVSGEHGQQRQAAGSQDSEKPSRRARAVASRTSQGMGMSTDRHSSSPARRGRLRAAAAASQPASSTTVPSAGHRQHHPAQRHRCALPPHP